MRYSLYTGDTLLFIEGQNRLERIRLDYIEFIQNKENGYVSDAHLTEHTEVYNK